MTKELIEEARRQVRHIEDKSKRERLISDLADALEAANTERDAALAAIERVRAVHRKFTCYELEDSCPDTSEDHREERHHESDEIGEFYCEDMPTGDVVCDLCRDADGERMDWPCPTVAALDGAPEPEETERVYRARNSILNSDAHVSEEAARATLQLMIENHPFEVEPEPVFIERRPRYAWLPVEGEKP